MSFAEYLRKEHANFFIKPQTPQEALANDLSIALAEDRLTDGDMSKSFSDVDVDPLSAELSVLAAKHDLVNGHVGYRFMCRDFPFYNLEEVKLFVCGLAAAHGILVAANRSQVTFGYSQQSFRRIELVVEDLTYRDFYFDVVFGPITDAHR